MGATKIGKNDNAPGIDGVLADLLKLLNQSAIMLLKKLFSSTFIPLPKKHSAKSLRRYRYRWSEGDVMS